MSTLSLWNFIFNHQGWMKNIENCSSKTPEEFKAPIPSYSFSVGLAYLIIGVLMEVIYILLKFKMHDHLDPIYPFYYRNVKEKIHPIFLL
jgi:hypothetical protein